MISKRDLTAPCGLDCFNCEIHEANLTTEFTNLIHKKLKIPKEEIPCKGCRQQDGKHYHLPPDGCATLDCVKTKGVEFCCDCNEFPCTLLAPLAEGAAKYPHNYKVYNLCRIKNIGFEEWVKEAEQVKKRYFTGKFIVGKGQGESGSRSRAELITDKKELKP